MKRHFERCAGFITKSATDPQLVAGIRHEAVVLRAVAHPQIPPLVEHEEHAGGAFLRTVDVGGTDLATEAPPDWDEAHRCAAGLLSVLADLHIIGWSHGAIRSEHVVRTPAGAIFVVSWRRAGRHDTSAAPAIARDVTAVGDMVAAWTASLPAPTTRQQPSAAALAAVVEACGRPFTTSGELAALLGVTRPTHPGPTAPPVAFAGRRRSTTATTSSTSPPWFDLGGAVVALIALVLLVSWRPRGPFPPHAPLDAVLALAWLAGIAVGGYALLVQSLATVVAYRHHNAIERALQRLAPSRARRVATLAAVGAGLARLGTSVVPNGPTTVAVVDAAPPNEADSVPSDSTPATTVAVPDPLARIADSLGELQVGALVGQAVGSPSADPVTTTPLADPAREPGPEQPPPAVAATETAPVGASVAVAPEAPSREHVVRPGDNFWRIATDTLTSERGRRPNRSETAAYWRSLIEANREQLVRPDNPNLLLPGQRLTLPPVPEQ